MNNCLFDTRIVLFEFWFSVIGAEETCNSCSWYPGFINGLSSSHNLSLKNSERNLNLASEHSNGQPKPAFLYDLQVLTESELCITYRELASRPLCTVSE
ncbi:hypothetical protein TNCT_675151 [Trichonephila clavata]|uniref:Uncharacterized protein n=1 Tax=Trichonephila clavata TaxID=2740835 RepID=A0A8X6H1Z3_TRICU|nr:hypothetical protein TNCT_675151 [Trichonephila clavata]